MINYKNCRAPTPRKKEEVWYIIKKKKKKICNVMDNFLNIVSFEIEELLLCYNSCH